jgi:hypothetical protein
MVGVLDGSARGVTDTCDADDGVLNTALACG